MENHNTNDHAADGGQSGPDFGPVIYSYPRLQAIADGFQVEVSKVAREAGITYPVFLTRAVYDKYVIVQPGVPGQEETGRLWDIIWMTRFAIIRMRSPRNRSTLNSGLSTNNPQLSTSHRLPVALYVRNHPQAAQLIKLIAVCGPLDIDDPQP